MKHYLALAGEVIRLYPGRLLGIALGFTVTYYALVMVFTIVRFGEIPNYVEFYNIFHVYREIWDGTPSLLDMIPIAADEAWFETGYKNPLYYGVATWSYMLIPPKMLLVFVFGLLLGLFNALLAYSRSLGCDMQHKRGLLAGAGFGSTMIALTNITLTWVVCCATPTWVVALTMLGMSASLSLLLQPLGNVMTLLGLGVMALVILKQLKSLAMRTVPSTTDAF